MPNGGYPLHLLLPVAGTDLALHSRASNLAVCRRRTSEDGPGTRPAFVPLGTVAADQVGSLLFHLLHWGGADMHALQPLLQDTHLWVAPHVRSTSCLYDY